MYFDFSFIRSLRKREGMNIAALSNLSGVSPAVISKLERNLCKAELETIHRIARALGQNTSDFMMLAESTSAHKNAEAKLKEENFMFREVKYGNVRCLLGKGKAGSRVDSPEIHRDNYELCWVIDGKVNFFLPGERHELKKGDSIQFDAMLEHTYEVVEDTEMLFIHILKDKRF